MSPKKKQMSNQFAFVDQDSGIRIPGQPSSPLDLAMTAEVGFQQTPRAGLSNHHRVWIVRYELFEPISRNVARLARLEPDTYHPLRLAG